MKTIQYLLSITILSLFSLSLAKSTLVPEPDKLEPLANGFHYEG